MGRPGAESGICARPETDIWQGVQPPAAGAAAARAEPCLEALEEAAQGRPVQAAQARLVDVSAHASATLLEGHLGAHLLQGRGRRTRIHRQRRCRRLHHRSLNRLARRRVHRTRRRLGLRLSLLRRIGSLSGRQLLARILPQRLSLLARVYTRNWCAAIGRRRRHSASSGCTICCHAWLRGHSAGAGGHHGRFQPITAHF